MCRGRGNKIFVGAVVKAKSGELDYEVRELFSIWSSKQLTDVVQVVSGNSMFLMVFNDGREKDLTSNQLTAVTVYMIPMTKEAKVPTIFAIPDDTVDLYKV